MIIKYKIKYNMPKTFYREIAGKVQKEAGTQEIVLPIYSEEQKDLAIIYLKEKDTPFTIESVAISQEALDEQKIKELKQKLADMDYKGQKYLDGEYSEEQWQAISTERKLLREQLRLIENN